MSVGSRGQSRPRSCGIKAAAGKKGRSSACAPRSGLRSAPPREDGRGLALRPPGRCFSPPSPCAPPAGWKQLCPPPSPAEVQAAREGQSVGQRASASPRTAACPRRSAASAWPPTRSLGSPGSCLLFFDLHPVPRGCLLLSARTPGHSPAAHVSFEAALRPCPRSPVPPRVRARGPAPRPREKLALLIYFLPLRMPHPCGLGEAVAPLPFFSRPLKP